MHRNAKLTVTTTIIICFQNTPRDNETTTAVSLESTEFKMDENVANTYACIQYSLVRRRVLAVSDAYTHT